MNYRALVPLALAAAIAFAQPVAFIAQEVGKAAEILAAARKAIGDKKLDALKTFSVQSSLQRNVQTMQVSSDVEIVLELPDKYLRSEASTGGGMIMAGGGTTGFNGDRPLQKLNAAQNLLTVQRMFAHTDPLFLSQLRGLTQNRIRHTDLADVV